MASQTVTVYSNGYVYPQEKENGYGSISSSGGLGAWVDTQGYTRIFFCPQATGELTVAVRAKAPSNANTLQLLLNGAGNALDVTVPLSNAFATIDAGTFQVVVAGQYHFVEIRAITKNGTYLPDVEALVLSGPAAADLKFNQSQFRSAPSTHLWYKADTPVAGDVAWFYNEITVPLGADPLNAYFMSNGFDGGYFGIQVNSATERRVLFSIWSNYNTDDPSQIPADYAVTLVKKGSDVYSGSFGNEGSGGQTYWKFMWKPETTYRLLVNAVASGDHTIYTGYFYMPESDTWKLIGQWDKAKTGGALLTGLYCFVENFGQNGNDYFEARFSNQWVYTVGGSWVELPLASFSTTASPTQHQRYDFGAGVHGNRMYMYSGGFRDVQNVESGGIVQRIPRGIPPSIDFNTLPTN